MPGDGARLALPSGGAPPSPLRLVVRVVATGQGDAPALAIDGLGPARPLAPGPQELAFELPETGLPSPLAVRVDGEVRVVAIAVVPRASAP